jgi:hypothetical protein
MRRANAGAMWSLNSRREIISSLSLTPVLIEI